jgi:hypothetical protein
MNASEATCAGQGEVIQAHVQAQQPMLRMIVEITRAATGKVETYELIGTPIEERSK